MIRCPHKPTWGDVALKPNQRLSSIAGGRAGLIKFLRRHETNAGQGSVYQRSWSRKTRCANHDIEYQQYRVMSDGFVSVVGVRSVTRDMRFLALRNSIVRRFHTSKLPGALLTKQVLTTLSEYGRKRSKN